jgi:hypothetical protein
MIELWGKTRKSRESPSLEGRHRQLIHDIHAIQVVFAVLIGAGSPERVLLVLRVLFTLPLHASV